MTRYILTGAPGCGKTSLINALEIANESYVIREAATDIIAHQQMLGSPSPLD